MPKGVKVKRDHIKQGDTLKPEEIDTLSAVDKGKDFVPQGQVA